MKVTMLYIILIYNVITTRVSTVIQDYELYIILIYNVITTNSSFDVMQRCVVYNSNL